MRITDVPYIHFSDLMALLGTPGVLEIDIKQVDGYFLPFVLFTAQGQERVMHGIIVKNNAAMACADLGDLVDALRAALGFEFTLHVPRTCDTTIH